jgi:hypothetical protein
MEIRSRRCPIYIFRLLLSLVVLVLFEAAAFAQGLGPDISGDWAGYYANGRQSPYVWRLAAVANNPGAFTSEDVGAGSGTRFTVTRVFQLITDSNGKLGNLSADSKQIKWSDGVIWKKLDKPVSRGIEAGEKSVYSNVLTAIKELKTTPVEDKIWGTYNADDLFTVYSAGIDHVGGIAWLSDGRYALAHSARSGRNDSLVVIQSQKDQTKSLLVGSGNHPGAIQATGMVIAVPIYGGTLGADSEVVFVDARVPSAPVKLPLRVAASGKLNSVGIAFDPQTNYHWLVTSTNPDYGTGGTTTFWRSNGKSLFDPECKFSTYLTFSNVWTSQGGTQLFYDSADKSLYLIAFYRADGATLEAGAVKAGEEGFEHIAVSKVTGFNTDRPKVEFVFDKQLSDSGVSFDYSPGFRWGGTLSVKDGNVRAVGISRLLTYGPAEPFAKIRIW